MPMPDEDAFIRTRDVVRIVENMPAFRGNVHQRPVRYFDDTTGDGITVENNSAVLTITCPDVGWNTFPFDAELAKAGVRWSLGNNKVTLAAACIVELSYKLYVNRIGASGVNSDDSCEGRIVFERGGEAALAIEASYAIGLIDDVDATCQGAGPFTEKTNFEGTAVCPNFLFSAQAGDVFSVEVQRKAGTQPMIFPSITGQSLDVIGLCSFFTAKFFAHV